MKFNKLKKESENFIKETIPFGWYKMTVIKTSDKLKITMIAQNDIKCDTITKNKGYDFILIKDIKIGTIINGHFKYTESMKNGSQEYKPIRVTMKNQSGSEILGGFIIKPYAYKSSLWNEIIKSYKDKLLNNRQLSRLSRLSKMYSGYGKKNSTAYTHNNISHPFYGGKIY